jgi:hypothetical protein
VKERETEHESISGAATQTRSVHDPSISDAKLRHGHGGCPGAHPGGSHPHLDGARIGRNAGRYREPQKGPSTVKLGALAG